MAIVDKYISHITPLNSSDTYKLKAYLLKNGRTFKVQLDSTNASTAFDGSANITDVGVDGTLGVANGGTGNTSYTSDTLIYAESSTQLSSYTSTRGGSKQLWYLDDGVPTDSEETVGDGEQPVYLDNGVITETTYHLKAHIEDGTQYRAAYYSNSRVIEDAGSIYMDDSHIGVNGTNTSYQFYVNGVSYLQRAATDANADGVIISHGKLQITNYSKTLHIGSADSGQYHFVGDDKNIQFYFDPSIQVNGYIAPYSDSNFDVGLTDHHWRVGYFDQLRVSTDTGFTAANSGKGGTEINSGSIELVGSTPFIDFHQAYSTADRTGRIIQSAAAGMEFSGTAATTAVSVNSLASAQKPLFKFIGETFINGVLDVSGNTNLTNNVYISSTSTNRARLYLRTYADQPNDLWLGANNTDKWSITCRNSAENYLLGIYSTAKSYVATFAQDTGVTTINYGLEVKGHIATSNTATTLGARSGGGYHSSYNNIVLYGDASTGSSGLVFLSSKGTANNNMPSDRAFIQYHALGITTASADATNPTLVTTSGESGKLVIGIGNDADDQIWLQAPSRIGLIKQVVNTSYVIPDTDNTTGTVGTATRPVYVDAGAIKQGTYELKATVNSGTANQVAYYSVNNTISSTSLSVSDPTASGSGITYIASISQNSIGKITATKSTVRDASASQSGVISIGAQTFAGNKTFNDSLVINANKNYPFYTNDNTFFVNKAVNWNSASYYEWVYLLIPVLTATNQSAMNYIDGTFHLWKTGGNVYDNVHVNLNCCYNVLEYYLESYGQGTDWKLVRCTYNGIQYYALKGYYHANPYTHVTFTGHVRSDLPGGNNTSTKSLNLPYAVAYYNYTSNSANAVVLNSEIKNSLTDTLTNTYVTSVTRRGLSNPGGFIGNASTASQLTDITTADAASSSATWRYVWFSYDNNKTGRPAYSSNLVFQTSTNTLKATKFQGALVGNADTATAFSSNATVTLTGDTTGVSAGSTKSWSVPTVTSALTVKGGRVTSADSAHAAADYSKMYLRIATDSMTTNKPKFSIEGEAAAVHDGHILEFHWDNSGAYNEQLALSNSKPAISVRAQPNGTWSAWTPVLTTINTKWVAWGAGTTAGPTAKLNIGGTTITSAAIPSASASASGIVTTGAQTFAGIKTFTNPETINTTTNGAAVNFKFSDAPSANTIYGQMWIAMGNNGGRFYWREWGGTSSGRTAGYEQYCLPACDAGQTNKPTYDILTTKNQAAPAKGTANRLAYYSAAGTISSGNIISDGNYISKVTFLSVNEDHQTGYNFEVNGSTNHKGNIYIQEVTAKQTAPSSEQARYIFFHDKDAYNNYHAYIASVHTTSNDHRLDLTTYSSGSSGTAGGCVQLMLISTNAGDHYIRANRRLIFNQTASQRNIGIYGTYDYTKAAAIWSMGDAYKIAANGSGLGNLYGAAYGYGGQAYLGSNSYAGGHQFLWCQNGAVNVALGNNVWTSGNVYAGTTSATTEHQVHATAAAGDIYMYSQGSTTGSRGIYLTAHGTGPARGVFGVDTNNIATYYGGQLMYRTISNSTSHALALKAEFDSHKADIPRSQQISYYSSAMSNGSIAMGYFLSGYDTGPYGGFFVAHYNTPRYVGISGGTYTQWRLLKGADSGAIGGTSTPIYIDANGIAQPCTAYGSATDIRAKTVYINDDTSTKLYVLGATTTGYTNIYRESSVTIESNILKGAAWNDYAEYRQAKNNLNISAGKVVYENGDDTLSISTQRLMRGCNIVSDTYGFAIGESEKAQLPIAVSGRVLAYPYESREEFKNHIGWPVCSGPNGTVSIMTEEEEMKYPSRIIGTISAVPDYEIWHGGTDIVVDGRVWIKVK